ncbi:hypothetical protein HZS_2370, partial [Henneguya salminicola]
MATLLFIYSFFFLAALSDIPKSSEKENDTITLKDIKGYAEELTNELFNLATWSGQPLLKKVSGVIKDDSKNIFKMYEHGSEYIQKKPKMKNETNLHYFLRVLPNQFDIFLKTFSGTHSTLNSSLLRVFDAPVIGPLLRKRFANSLSRFGDDVEKYFDSHERKPGESMIHYLCHTLLDINSLVNNNTGNIIEGKLTEYKRTLSQKLSNITDDRNLANLIDYCGKEAKAQLKTPIKNATTKRKPEVKAVKISSEKIWIIVTIIISIVSGLVMIAFLVCGIEEYGYYHRLVNK